MKFLIFLFVLGVVLVKEGYCFQCLVSNCRVNNDGTTTCEPGKAVKTCPAGEQHCMTMSTKTIHAGKTMTVSVNNCSNAVACSDQYKNMTCEVVRKQNASCDIKCCNEDKCNVPTLSPTGAKLSCYVCQTGNGKDSNCEQQRKCDEARGSLPAHDSCGITKYQRQDAKTGKIKDIEHRNCTFSTLCASICQQLNQTGDLVSCNANCCQGNLCNGHAAKTTLFPPKAGQNACALINMMTIIVGVIVSMYFE